jgi:hypothetical protein
VRRYPAWVWQITILSIVNVALCWRISSPVWKVCIARRISLARNFDAFYIFTIKFSKSPARNFETFQSGLRRRVYMECTLEEQEEFNES